MSNIYISAKWHIVLTRAGCEKKVAAYLAKKQMEFYLPLNTLRVGTNDSSKLKQQPLLKDYVFIRIAESQVANALKTPGVLRLIYWLNKPAIINDEEIETIRYFLQQYKTLQIETTSVNNREPVTSNVGASITKSGNLTEILHNSTKVTLPSLGIILVSLVAERADDDMGILNKIKYNEGNKMMVTDRV